MSITVQVATFLEVPIVKSGFIIVCSGLY